MGKKKKQEKQKEKKKKLLKAEKKEKAALKKQMEASAPGEKTAPAEKTVPVKKTVPMKASVPEKKDAQTKVSAPSGGMSASEAMLVFRALGDETRMQILSLLNQNEMCGIELLERVSVVQSTLSHHMKILTESGVVSSRKDNKRIYYSICLERMEEAAAYLISYEERLQKEKENHIVGGSHE